MNTNFNEIETEQKREWLLSLLHAGTVEVTFTKVDGTIRVMNCSLNPTLLPVVTQVAESVKRTTSLNNIRVFDIEKQAWRSFKIENVISVSI
jgi:hypothetical protein